MKYENPAILRGCAIGAVVGGVIGIGSALSTESNNTNPEAITKEINACATELDVVAKMANKVPDACRDQLPLSGSTFSYSKDGQSYYLLPSKEMMKLTIPSKIESDSSEGSSAPHNIYLIGAWAAMGLVMGGSVSIHKYKILPGISS